MNYKNFKLIEWLDYLENRHQQEIQLGLTRIHQVAERLDLLRPTTKVITVAGTNGKGSTVAFLEAIYITAGYQVASYTSPHLIVFNERIRINRIPITDEQLCTAFCNIEVARGDINLTYFEMTTLAALWHFKQFALDLIILEVGLGGRLDATNIIDSDLAIITTIDFDHQAYLGNTIEEIAYEKAGILRANKPFIYADKSPPQSIIKQAQVLKASSYFNGKDYYYDFNNNFFKFKFKNKTIEIMPPKLHGNAVASGLMASLIIQDQLPIQTSDLQKAVKTTFLQGRLQLINKEKATLFDVAHNPQAVRYLANFLKCHFPYKTIHAVFSALTDKDLLGIIEPLKETVNYWYPAKLNAKRAASEEQLSTALNHYNIISTVCYETPLIAYKAACQKASADDLIVVYGSFITVGEILGSIVNKIDCEEITNFMV